MPDTIAPAETFAVSDVTTISERIVVAPCGGRFSPLSPDVFTSEGEWVEPNQVLAEIVSGESRTPVHSPFRGWMMGMLALDGQPVRAGEALFWIWSS